MKRYHLQPNDNGFLNSQEITFELNQRTEDSFIAFYEYLKGFFDASAFKRNTLKSIKLMKKTENSLRNQEFRRIYRSTYIIDHTTYSKLTRYKIFPHNTYKINSNNHKIENNYIIMVFKTNIMDYFEYTDTLFYKNLRSIPHEQLSSDITFKLDGPQEFRKQYYSGSYKEGILRIFKVKFKDSFDYDIFHEGYLLKSSLVFNDNIIRDKITLANSMDITPTSIYIN